MKLIDALLQSKNLAADAVANGHTTGRPIYCHVRNIGRAYHGYVYARSVYCDNNAQEVVFEGEIEIDRIEEFSDKWLPA